MCWNGRIGHCGTGWGLPEWADEIYNRRNDLLDAVNKAQPIGDIEYDKPQHSEGYMEDIIDPEFEKIDAIINCIIDKLMTARKEKIESHEN
jgi:hypothetical protein